jgi:jasmonate O-methyltransferase
MNGGTGEKSYAKNSSFQVALMTQTMQVLQQAVADFSNTDLPKCVTIANLGCSSGPNALTPISKITQIIYSRCVEIGKMSPEFNVYLNDLPGNDFNTVFESLPEFLEKTREENGPGFGPLYIGGVPGSFYERLFASKSLHFVHSSTSLHWLSQVPPELKSNSLINKGKLFISKTTPSAVIDAYFRQFKRDFALFLRLRAAEVAPGGRMVLIFKGRRTLDPTTDESCLLWDYLAQAIQGLIAEGLIGEEKLDTYNTPFYEAYVEDIRALVEEDGCFIVDRLEIKQLPWGGGCGVSGIDRAKLSIVMTKGIRAVNENMFQRHFGQEIMDLLFQRFTEILANDTKEVDHCSVVLSLIRKFD